MIITWTQENKNSHWSEGLRFVQFQKNRSYHRTIEQSPYKALFGSDPKVGLSSSAIPKELLDTLETEEDLNSVVVANSNEDTGTHTEIETDTDLDIEDQEHDNIPTSKCTKSSGCYAQANF